MFYREISNQTMSAILEYFAESERKLSKILGSRKSTFEIFQWFRDTEFRTVCKKIRFRVSFIGFLSMIFFGSFIGPLQGFSLGFKTAKRILRVSFLKYGTTFTRKSVKSGKIFQPLKHRSMLGFSGFNRPRDSVNSVRELSTNWKISSKIFSTRKIYYPLWLHKDQESKFERFYELNLELRGKLKSKKSVRLKFRIFSGRFKPEVHWERVRGIRWVPFSASRVKKW